MNQVWLLMVDGEPLGVYTQERLARKSFAMSYAKVTTENVPQYKVILFDVADREDHL